MVRKIFNKAISAVTTTLLAFTTLASAIPVTTYAASPTVKVRQNLRSKVILLELVLELLFLIQTLDMVYNFHVLKILRRRTNHLVQRIGFGLLKKMEDMMKVLVVMQLRNVLVMHGFLN